MQGTKNPPSYHPECNVEILRSRRSLAVVAGKKKTNDHAEPQSEFGCRTSEKFETCKSCFFVFIIHHIIQGELWFRSFFVPCNEWYTGMLTWTSCISRIVIDQYAVVLSLCAIHLKLLMKWARCLTQMWYTR